MRAKLIVAALIWCAFARAAVAEAEIRLCNPPGLWQPSTFSQIGTLRGGTTVYISGQTSRDARGRVVGQGNVDALPLQVFENLKTALSSVGGAFQHVVKINTYVKNLRPNDRVMYATRFPKTP